MKRGVSEVFLLSGKVIAESKHVHYDKIALSIWSLLSSEKVFVERKNKCQDEKNSSLVHSNRALVNRGKWNFKIRNQRIDATVGAKDKANVDNFRSIPNVT